MQPTPVWDTPPRLLVVDDEDTVRGLLADALRFAGFAVTAVPTGAEAVTAALDDPPDLIVLDVMLPGMDGFEVIRELRAASGGTRPVPVLFLSARDAPEDKVNGLTLGGDDYITKPFHLPELIARIQAVLRRASGAPNDGVLAVADLTLDPAAREVKRAGRAIRLSPTEFKLLHYLMTRAGHVVARPQILEEVWRYDFAGDTSIVDTYVSYLRRKIDAAEPKLIHTVHGVGYVLRGPRR
ncbi:response regulator transcription factor [Actinoplanes sp. GCM10030250]|uniref:response regulator transcription factor n=1 Tax=Actinoplanes sp. GCM10030250 TaxID=3273376 RepID=UPI003609166A